MALLQHSKDVLSAVVLVVCREQLGLQTARTSCQLSCLWSVGNSWQCRQHVLKYKNNIHGVSSTVFASYPVVVLVAGLAAQLVGTRIVLLIAVVALRPGSCTTPTS